MSSRFSTVCDKRLFAWQYSKIVYQTKFGEDAWQAESPMKPSDFP
ncbi:hypothetical protein [Leptolyngbya sp. FACHB-671]|nr:hypothetical protein [Leptolyngbya sp. FACHB-671]